MLKLIAVNFAITAILLASAGCSQTQESYNVAVAMDDYGYLAPYRGDRPSLGQSQAAKTPTSQAPVSLTSLAVPPAEPGAKPSPAAAALPAVKRADAERSEFAVEPVVGQELPPIDEREYQ